MQTDGKKLIGRFIKNKSTLLKKVSLQEFDFEEVFEGRVAETDNMNRNIIHTKFHDESDQEVFTLPEGFEVDLLPRQNRRPVLRPIDFTPEWEEERKRSKTKPQSEDEEFNLLFNRDRDRQKERDEKVKEAVEAADAADAAEAAEADATVQAEPPEAAPTQEVAAADISDIATSPDMDSVGNAINELVQHDEETRQSQPTLNSDDPTAVVANHEEAPVDEFIPAATQSLDSEIHDPETAPAEQYQQQVQASVSQVDIDNALESAKSQGFEQGFKEGEAKAALQARERVGRVFGKVTDIIKEFETLKHNILDNVQQNFYELSQAIAETLIKRELKLNPQAFAEVIRKAIDEAVEPDTFKVHINPEMYDQVKALGVEDLTSSLVKDDSIDLGDFRIESDLSVVDGNIRKVIADLLEQADMTLFDTEDDEKAS